MVIIWFASARSAGWARFLLGQLGGPFCLRH